MEEVKLFRTWSSPFALRIVWALKLKGIPYETIYEDLTNKSPLLLKYNPIHKKIPTLLHNGKPVCESLVILEYIDETWTGTARFMPEDPVDRAIARFWAKFNDEQLYPSLFNYLMNNGKNHDETKQKVFDNLKLVEQHLNGKKFFGGDTIGFLDLAFGWLAYYPDVIKQACNLQVLDEETFPKICTWKKNFCDILMIQENWPDRKALIAKFQHMRQGHGIFYSTTN